MQRFFFLCISLTCLILISCASLKKEEESSPSSSFNVCYSYGCKTVQAVSLAPEQWLVIEQLFIPKAVNAAQERKQIARAIAHMETYVGKITHTQNDLPGTFQALFKNLSYQMDCVDEATNTTVYIKLFQQRGFVNYHLVGHRINRGFFFNGWPHTSAAIKEVGTGQQFAVDSWFHRNGVEPEIIPVSLWYSGWHPSPKESSH